MSRDSKRRLILAVFPAVVLAAVLPLSLRPLNAGAADDLAAPKPAAPAGDKGPLAAVAPFIDEETAAVIRLDLTRLDLKAVESWVNGALKDAKDEPRPDPQTVQDFRGNMAKSLPAAKAWFGSFTKAGVHDVYLLVSLADVARSPAYVVPLSDTADAKMIENLFAPAGPSRFHGPHAYGLPPDDSADPSGAPAAEQVGRVVVAARAGVVRRLRSLKPADRPDLAEALATAGDAPLAIAFAPPADARRVIDELLPRLPPELGGGSSKPVARGLRWAALAGRFPPGPSLTLTVRAADADSTHALAGVVGHLRDWLAAQRPAVKGEPETTALVTLALAIIPRPSPDHPEELVAKVEGPAMDKLVVAELTGNIKSNFTKSAENMKQILLACLMAKNQDVRGDKWPDSLETVLKTQEITADVFVNPSHPDSRPGYTYVRPARHQDTKDDDHLLVLYETEPGPGGRHVGFADGHVELMDEAHFQEALKVAKERLTK